MYCQTSISVQLESGNTRKCSPERLAAVEQVPELGPLVLGVPLPEGVAVAEEALLRPRLLLVAAPAAEGRVHLELAQRVQQRDRLQGVAAGVRARSPPRTRPASMESCTVRTSSSQPEPLRQPVAELDGLREVVPRVDVQQREGKSARPERLARQVHHHDRVLAAGEEQHGALELRRDLAHHVDGLALELGEVAAAVRARPRTGSRWRGFETACFGDRRCIRKARRGGHEGA